jgi:hypothetical protein
VRQDVSSLVRGPTPFSSKFEDAADATDATAADATDATAASTKSCNHTMNGLNCALSIATLYFSKYTHESGC